ncbi:MAG: peptidylprolyl isomerase [Planctomycetota bacterium]
MKKAPAARRDTVKLQTSAGDIVIGLDAQAAPVTVKNFLGYVRAGFYDGTIFHRVIHGFMIQGGGFTADMVQKETHDPIANEANNGLSNARGTIAMARSNDPDSATCQFFINHVDNPRLDYVANANSDQLGNSRLAMTTYSHRRFDRLFRSPVSASPPPDGPGGWVLEGDI